jgi:hypothetical protein
MLAEVVDIASRRLGRKGSAEMPSPLTIEAKAEAASTLFTGILETIMAGGMGEGFTAVETHLRKSLNGLGVILLELFLMVCAKRIDAALESVVLVAGRKFKRRPAKQRSYSCVFGVLQYTRTYLLGLEATQEGGREGHFPLDAQLGMCADRVSMGLISLASRIATKISFAQTALVTKLFLGHSPSTEVIQRAVLGMGMHAVRFQNSPPVIEGDGEVMVIQIDGKAAPQATDGELEKRRGKRRKRQLEQSARHRGRAKRKRSGPTVRRAKGDKSKNGKVAHVVVVYTLRREGKSLVGPVNKRVFASFRPKRAAFETAIAEAMRRGFGPDSGKTVQLVTDGDRDLSRLKEEYLPHAEHTIDVMHVIEYIWKAGHLLFGEGTVETKEWVEARKEELYTGRVSCVLRELTRKMNQTSSSIRGREKKSKLKRIREYIEHRKQNMNYANLQERDLEIGSGSVEGAVNNVIGKRFDQGGMRWIKGRAEALLQLRCIEINGHWDTFVERVEATLLAEGRIEGKSTHILSNQPINLEQDLRAA